jgi:hypothetical protein
VNLGTVTKIALAVLALCLVFGGQSQGAAILGGFAFWTLLVIAVMVGVRKVRGNQQAS